VGSDMICSMRRMTLILVLAVAIGCDRPSASNRRPVQLAKKSVLQLKVISQLPPNRVAHLAYDRMGRVLYSYESNEGSDAVFIVGENGLPRATRLTSSNILAALGETVGGTGTIQDLVTSSDGAVYFYFTGGKGRAIRACVGRFIPQNESMSILIDTARMAKFSQMGDSIALARGQLLQMGSRMGLFIRHTDAWTLFTFDPRNISINSESEISRPFVKVVGEEDQQINLAQLRYELSEGPGENLLLYDRNTGTLWQLDPAGRATVRALLNGLPREMSRPLVMGPSQLLMFVADSEPIESEMSDLLRRRLPRVSFPALFEITDKEFTAMGREDFRIAGEFPIYAMRIHEIIQMPDGSFVGYDMSSGQLLRLRKVEEE
jgi:hypothetical protein